MPTQQASQTTTEPAAWFDALSAETEYGIELYIEDSDGNTHGPWYETAFTRPADPPEAPRIEVWPGLATDTPQVWVRWTEVASAYEYAVRLKDESDTVVDSLTRTATAPGTVNEAAFPGSLHQLCTVEVEAINSAGSAIAAEDGGPRHWLGGTFTRPVATSHATATFGEFDESTNYPAYMQGQVFVDGAPAQRDVLVIDRLTFEPLYRPKVDSAGNWQVRNIADPPRAEWRAYMAVFRDLPGEYNAEVIDHIKPAMV